MARMATLGSIGGLLAVALVAHLWMLASSGAPLPSDPPPVVVATHSVAIGGDGACPTGMAACVATAVDTRPVLVAAALSTLPVVLRRPRRRPSSAPRGCREDLGPSPLLTLVTERVLLLE